MADTEEAQHPVDLEAVMDLAFKDDAMRAMVSESNHAFLGGRARSVGIEEMDAHCIALYVTSIARLIREGHLALC